jgi:hypothetical protein
LLPWLVQTTSAGVVVTIQVILYALAAAVFVARTLSVAPTMRRFVPAAALATVLLSAAFTSWQDAILTEGLALTCAVLLVSCVPGLLLSDRVWPDVVLASLCLLALSQVRSAAALYAVVALTLMLGIRWAGVRRRLSTGQVLIGAMTAVLVILLALPVTIAHAERYEAANARKRDLKLLMWDGGVPPEACVLSAEANGDQICDELVRRWRTGEPSSGTFAVHGGLQRWALTALPDQLAFRDIRLPDVADASWPQTPPRPVALSSDLWALLTRLVLPVGWLAGLVSWGVDERDRRHLWGWTAPSGLALLGLLTVLPWMAVTWLTDPYEAMRHAMPWSLVAVCLLPSLSMPIRQLRHR